MSGVSAESVGTHVRDMRERGFTVFEKALSDAEVDALQRTMHRLHGEAGSPGCYSRQPKMITPEIELCTTGLVFYKFIKRCPEHADLLMQPDIIASIRGYLGEDMELELTGAVIVDSTRPFFDWHTHFGGPDDSSYRRAGVWPTIEKPQRLMSLLYVDGIQDDNGPLLVYPRRVTDPTPPPHDPLALDWPDETVVHVPPGSVVLMDQCTWHAVKPKLTPGIRSFVGCYYRASDAPPTAFVDESLRGFKGGGDLLHSVLPRA